MWCVMGKSWVEFYIVAVCISPQKTIQYRFRFVHCETRHEWSDLKVERFDLFRLGGIGIFIRILIYFKVE